MTNQQLLKIKKFAKQKMDQSLDVQHDWEHVLRVTRNALAIARTLEVKDLDLNLLKAICYLHDITYAKYKPSLKVYFREGKLAQKMLRNFLPQFKLSQQENENLLNAIRRHPFAFPFRRLNKKQDIYSKILQDADFIDTFDPARRATFIDSKQSQAFFIRLIRNVWDIEKKLDKTLKSVETYLNFSGLTDLIESLKHEKK